MPAKKSTTVKKDVHPKSVKAKSVNKIQSKKISAKKTAVKNTVKKSVSKPIVVKAIVEPIEPEKQKRLVFTLACSNCDYSPIKHEHLSAMFAVIALLLSVLLIYQTIQTKASPSYYSQESVNSGQTALNSDR